VHLQERGKHLHAGRVQQKRGLAVLTGAANGADEMPDESARHVGGESHGSLARGEPPCAEARQRALAGDAADDGGILEVGRVARNAVPVIALHLRALLGQQRAAHRMAGGGVAGEEPERVAIHAGMALAADRGAFGVADTRVHRKSRRFALARQLDGAFGGEVPGVVEVEVRDVAGERLGVDEPGIRILGGVARDRARLADRLEHRRAAEIRGARGALALAEIHGHGEAAVALVLDGVDLAQAHACRESAAHGGVGFALRGPEPPGLIAREAHDVAQLFGAGQLGTRLHGA